MEVRARRFLGNEACYSQTSSPKRMYQCHKFCVVFEGVEVEAKSPPGTLQFLNFLVEGYTTQNVS